MAEIMQGGEIFKQVDAREGRQPVFIRVASYSEGDQVIIAKKGDAFLSVGLFGLRNDPDDRYNIETHKTYIQISPEQINRKTGLTVGENELQEDISIVFARKLKQYIDETGGL